MTANNSGVKTRTVNLTVNGEPWTADVGPWVTLMDLLRERGRHDVKHGCESGECGACAVLVDGEVRVSCLTLAAAAEGADVTTVAALGEPGALHPIQEAFVATGAIQCGYCTPGMILATKELLERSPDPTEAEIRDQLAGVLCRCTGYVKPIEAIRQAAATLRSRSG